MQLVPNYSLLTGSQDSSLTIYDVQQEHVVLASIPRGIGHSGQVTDVHWFPADAGMFSTSSVDGTLKLWDANALTPAHSFSLDSPIHTHAMPPSTTSHCLLAAGTDSSIIRLCDMKSGASTHSLSGSAPCHMWDGCKRLRYRFRPRRTRLRPGLVSKE
jgi:DNA excision repair protein ERCC-8